MTQERVDNIENKDKPVQGSSSEPGLIEEQASKMFDAWLEVMKAPTIGPFYAFSKNLESYASDLANLGKILTELGANSGKYWSLVNEAYVKAYKETGSRAPKEIASKEQFETFRRVMIEAFENSFTGLFDSKEFALVYGKLFSGQMDVLKSVQNIVEKNAAALNLPTRSELDEMLKDIHQIKKDIRELRQRRQEVSDDESAGTRGEREATAAKPSPTS